MQEEQRDWMHTLFRLVIVLVALLVVLSSFAVVYVLYGFLHRFGQVIFLFALGAIIAYILTPLVNAAQLFLHRRWAAILSVYVVLVAGLLLLSVLLFRPFISQSQSLVDNLQNPAPSSLLAIEHAQRQITAIQTELEIQGDTLLGGSTIPHADVLRVQSQIRALQTSLLDLTKSPTTQTPIKRGQQLQPQTQVPASYAAPVIASARSLASDYRRVTAGSGKLPEDALSKPLADARKTTSTAATLHRIVATTPALILRAQIWIDQRGFKLNLHDNFGNAIQELSNRGASLLNNALGIVTRAANVLVNTFLVLIISIYFLADGRRLIRKAVLAAPRRYRDEAQFFLRSTDKVLGSYLRGQFLLALLAALLGAGGAALLGVPYAALIFVSTFLLELVPVIGPVILIIPPVLISAIFDPATTTIIIFVYFMVFQQIVTNVIGPRVVGGAVGIHPLEAMAAALIGYPLAGFLGSFMAVPTVGILHIIAREARREFRKQEEVEAADADPSVQPAAPSSAMSVPPP
jgi:predicted PurR-regulated permease PerM